MTFEDEMSLDLEALNTFNPNRQMLEVSKFPKITSLWHGDVIKVIPKNGPAHRIDHLLYHIGEKARDDLEEMQHFINHLEKNDITTIKPSSKLGHASELYHHIAKQLSHHDTDPTHHVKVIKEALSHALQEFLNQDVNDIQATAKELNPNKKISIQALKHTFEYLQKVEAKEDPYYHEVITLKAILKDPIHQMFRSKEFHFSKEVTPHDLLTRLIDITEGRNAIDVINENQALKVAFLKYFQDSSFVRNNFGCYQELNTAKTMYLHHTSKLKKHYDELIDTYFKIGSSFRIKIDEAAEFKSKKGEIFSKVNKAPVSLEDIINLNKILLPSLIKNINEAYSEFCLTDAYKKVSKT